MKRIHFILGISLFLLLGAGIAFAALQNEKSTLTRGYRDATLDANLPYYIDRLGVNVDLRGLEPAELTRQLALMNDLGVRWVRQFIYWSDVQGTSGFDGSLYQPILDAVETFPALSFVAVLKEAPNPLEIDQSLYDYANYQIFAEFANEFAEQFGHQVDYYQIWDEPNLYESWGEQNPRANEYVTLLAQTSQAIRSQDNSAYIIAGALAPTTEIGPRNISDIVYLEQLINAGITEYIDAFAGKPYGFDESPETRVVNLDTLNFARMILLREVLERHNLGTYPLWGSSWGWNALPAAWTGQPSIWGSVTSEQQIDYTNNALERVEREWPWVGGMILHQWQARVDAENPQWGFSLLDAEGEVTLLYNALLARPRQSSVQNGLLFPRNDQTKYYGVWTFGDLGADIGWVQDSQLSFEFHGANIALLLRRDQYTALLYPTVDGQPANALPRDLNGNAYINLTSPMGTPSLDLIAVAQNLAPQNHVMHVIADRGWDRWALAGIGVSGTNPSLEYDRTLTITAITFVTSLAAVIATAWQVNWSTVTKLFRPFWYGLGSIGQLLVSFITSIALMIGMLLTWGDSTPAIFRNESVRLTSAFLTAGLIYLQVHVIITVIAGAILFVILYHRPMMGLWLTLFFAPFFLFPIELYRFFFPMAELLLLLTTGATLLRGLAIIGKMRRDGIPISLRPFRHITALDVALALWAGLGIATLIWSQWRGEAVTEIRTLFIEPLIFYTLLRVLKPTPTQARAFIYALILSAVVVCVVGLFQYVRGEAIITAEDGARRLASVYGSPNNVSLWLGRAIPFVLVFAFANQSKWRWLFSAGLLLMLGTQALTQSAGGLFIGVPLSIITVLILWFGKRAWMAVIGLGIFGGIGLFVASQTARFERLFTLTEGTNFFRLRVWESAVNMIRDYPITGIGQDQFLYLFRSRYILPDAWQEPDLSHPHNFVLEIWLRLGILGVILFGWLQGLFWRNIYHILRHTERRDLVYVLAVGTAGSMVNVLAHGLIDNSIFVNDLAIVFVFLLFLSQRLNTRPIDAPSQKMV